MMHSLLINVAKGKSLSSTELNLPIIPVVGDTVAVEKNGPWYVITKRIINGYKSEFEAEPWAVEASSIELSDLKNLQ